MRHQLRKGHSAVVRQLCGNNRMWPWWCWDSHIPTVFSTICYVFPITIFFPLSSFHLQFSQLHTPNESARRRPDTELGQNTSMGRHPTSRHTAVPSYGFPWLYPARLGIGLNHHSGKTWQRQLYPRRIVPDDFPHQHHCKSIWEIHSFVHFKNCRGLKRASPGPGSSHTSCLVDQGPLEGKKGNRHNIFADIESTFPSVHHLCMIHTLETPGHPPELTNIFQTFLTGRETYLSFKGFNLSNF